MRSANALAGLALGALVLGGAVGCSSGPPKPTITKTALVASGDVNPDVEGHSAPIVVRVYELKEEGAFDNADYFRLIDKEPEALAASLLSREEFELQPGESRPWELKIQPEARFVAAAAGFRDLANSHWKALLPIPRKGFKKKKLTINVSRSAVTLAVGK